ncbi:hypothetical protein ACLIKD_06795 [Azonexus sp. IMCC34842]|uniref:hypothetical protein n=1 Tax=Azonexus sp. IMCC34842 TaxID=3420950 RepID=UPI003D0D5B01
MAAPSNERTILKSLWDGLNPNLIAKFYEVDRKGAPIGNVEVHAPLTDANLEMTFSWNSPFENAGAESKAPAVLQLLQSRLISELLDELAPNDGSAIDKGLKNLSGAVKNIEGRAGISKLNSTQVFVGMPPVKIPVTALFRAWRDPVQEVEDPIDQLTNWALPVKLADDGTMATRAIKAAQGKQGAVDVLLPSQVPTMIAMLYKGRTYGPLVIESIGQPISAPIDFLGNYVSMAIPMTLCSLTAIDREDWKSMKNYFSPDP